MLKRFIKLASLAMIVVFSTTSCLKDLDLEPTDKTIITSANVYKTEKDYVKVMNKIYAGLALTGQKGGDGGLGDIGGIDEGFSSYIRGYWNLQELPTDEAVCAWGDLGIAGLNFQEFDSQNPFIQAFYYRVIYQATLANEFLRETTDAKISERGHNDFAANIEIYRAEARLLRALSYYHALDLYGNIPFVLEEDGIGAFLPKQIMRADLFAWLETELKDLEPSLLDAKTAPYGRMDKASAWFVLSKLYLNAKVYVGTENNADVLTYTEKIINAGYGWEADYKNLFLADNHTAVGVIFNIPQQGGAMESNGSTTFIINSSTGGDMDAAVIGVGGWGGNRAIPTLVDLFAANDLRGEQGNDKMIFPTAKKNVDDVAKFTEGYGVQKFKNIDKDGNLSGSGTAEKFVDTDFPLFRVADAYLMYAEAKARMDGDNSTDATALGYLNMVRNRAGIADATSINLNEMLKERGREFYWEGHRRTDLVRFDKFTGGSYLWQWKGGAKDGASTSDHQNIFPIPASDIGANPSLKQNTGY